MDTDWHCINWDQVSKAKARFRPSRVFAAQYISLRLTGEHSPLFLRISPVNNDLPPPPEGRRKQTWAALAIPMNDAPSSACRQAALGMLGKSLFYDLWPHENVRKACGSGEEVRRPCRVIGCKSYLQWYCNWIRSRPPFGEAPDAATSVKTHKKREFNFTAIRGREHLTFSDHQLASKTLMLGLAPIGKHWSIDFISLINYIFKFTIYL